MPRTHEIICREAQYIIKHSATVRQAGRYFGRSKSTIHKDMREKLPRIDHILAASVTKVLEANLADRHNRGGMSTKAKYEMMRGN